MWVTGPLAAEVWDVVQNGNGRRWLPLPRLPTLLRPLGCASWPPYCREHVARGNLAARSRDPLVCESPSVPVSVPVSQIMRALRSPWQSCRALVLGIIWSGSTHSSVRDPICSLASRTQQKARLIRNVRQVREGQRDRGTEGQRDRGTEQSDRETDT